MKLQKSKSIETSQFHYVLNKSTQDEVDLPTVKHVTEFEISKKNWEKKWGKVNKCQVIPTEKDLQTYPSAHLTSPQEWNPPVLDYALPEANGELDCTNDPTENFQFDQKIEKFDDYINKSLLHPNSHQLVTYIG